MRRTIYIIIGVIVIAIIALAAWWFFFRNQTSQVTPSGTTGTLPQTGTQSGGNNGGSASTAASSTAGGTNQALVKSFGVLAVGPVFNYFVDKQNNTFIIAPDGAISEVASGQSSQASVLSSTPIENLISAAFSYDGKKILVNFGSSGNPQSSIFDIATKAWTPLPQGLISPRWSPSDYRIAYLLGGAVTSLSTIDAANLKKAAVLLTTLDVQDFALTQWFGKSQFILSGRPTAYVPTSVLLFDASKSTVVPLISNQNGAESLWIGPTSSTAALGLVFIQKGSTSHALQLISTAGASLQTLSFITLPSKCLFNVEQVATDTMLYCGIPRDAGAFSTAHLPDDYDQMVLFTSDDLYRINTVTGVTDSLLADQSQNFDITNLKFFNGTLFFVNRYDQKLYAIVL